MRRKVIVLVIGILLGSLAFECCGLKDVNKSKMSGIQKVVNDFYESSYEYEKIENSTSAGIKTVVTYQGKIIQPDYKEYVQVTSAPTGGIWSEAYYYGKGKMIHCKLLSDGEWVETMANRVYPYGYGEELVFGNPTEKDGQQIYTAEYQVDVGKMTGSDQLLATVHQTYEYDPVDHVIVRIDTDLTELNHMTAIANDMRTNGTSLEEASKNVEKDDFESSEELLIKNVNGDIEIEIPN